MTTVTIDNRSYPCPSAWNEIGWEQFFTLAEYAGQTVGTSATERKAERVLERICGVDPGTVRKIDGRQRKQFADCLGERFFGFPPPFPENPDGNGSTDGFDWNGIRMLFPAPAVDPDGSVVPLAHTTSNCAKRPTCTCATNGGTPRSSSRYSAVPKVNPTGNRHAGIGPGA